jgi:hypothetical protein
MQLRALPILATSVLLLTGAAGGPAPVQDDEIRATFVGKAACPEKPWPVSFGPYEFRPDGAFFRAQDLAPWSGRYTVAGGQICITPASARPDAGSENVCFEVLKDETQYFLRPKVGPASSAAPTANASPVQFPVTPCPLPE